MHVCVCVCLRLEFKGLFTCVDMFVSSPLGGNHCVSEKLKCARPYSEVDYVPGSVLLLTIPKSFCLLEEMSLETTTRLLSSHREHGGINPVRKMQKRDFFFLEIQGRLDEMCLTDQNSNEIIQQIFVFSAAY